MNGHLCTRDESGEEEFGTEKLSTLCEVRVQVPGKVGQDLPALGFPAN